jgi:signal peptidase I
VTDLGGAEVAVGRDDRSAGSGRRRRRTARPVATGLLLLGVLALVAAAALVLLRLETVVVRTASMEPTLHRGDHVLLDHGRGPVRHGDLVLFRADGWGLVGSPYELKRVVALGGDHVVCCDAAGQLRLNQESLIEPYLKADDGTAPVVPFDVIVPAGRMFLLGDDRADPSDSRAHLGQESGTVPVTAVRARAVAVLLPPRRAGALRATGERRERLPLWELTAGLLLGGALALPLSALGHLRPPRR